MLPRGRGWVAPCRYPTPVSTEASRQPQQPRKMVMMGSRRRSAYRYRRNAAEAGGTCQYSMVALVVQQLLLQLMEVLQQLLLQLVEVQQLLVQPQLLLQQLLLQPMEVQGQHSSCWYSRRKGVQPLWLGSAAVMGYSQWIVLQVQLQGGSADAEMMYPMMRKLGNAKSRGSRFMQPSWSSRT